MKVKDLLARLSRLNPDIDILVYSEDPGLLSEGESFRILDITDIDTGKAVRDRGPMREPILRFGHGPDAQEIAFLHVVLDF